MTITKVRKSINIDDFVRLWKDIEDKNWAKVMPSFWRDITDAWKTEILQKFLLMKRNNSYGPLPVESIKILLQSNPKTTYLPRDVSYPPPERYRELFGMYDPHTYVKTGYLKSAMKADFPYKNINNKNEIGVRVYIPAKRQSEETQGYRDLEEQRSFVKSSFVLAWPQIIQKTLESIYNG